MARFDFMGRRIEDDFEDPAFCAHYRPDAVHPVLASGLPQSGASGRLSNGEDGAISREELLAAIVEKDGALTALSAEHDELKDLFDAQTTAFGSLTEAHKVTADSLAAEQAKTESLVRDNVALVEETDGLKTQMEELRARIAELETALATATAKPTNAAAATVSASASS